jgi:sec-independent protein translocase protein TatA
MGFGSPIHWIVLLLVVVLLFGSGRVSSLMGDVAKGIKSFRKGMAEDEEDRGKSSPSRIDNARVVDATPEHDARPAGEDRP